MTDNKNTADRIDERRRTLLKTASCNDKDSFNKYKPKSLVQRRNVLKLAGGGVVGSTFFSSMAAGAGDPDVSRLEELIAKLERFGALAPTALLVDYRREELDVLQSEVDERVSHRGISDALGKKLEAAAASNDRAGVAVVDADSSTVKDNVEATNDQLQSFIDHVSDQKGKKIDEEDANSLILHAQKLLDAETDVSTPSTTIEHPFTTDRFVDAVTGTMGDLQEEVQRLEDNGHTVRFEPTRDPPAIIVESIIVTLTVSTLFLKVSTVVLTTTVVAAHLPQITMTARQTAQMMTAAIYGSGSIQEALKKAHAASSAYTALIRDSLDTLEETDTVIDIIEKFMDVFEETLKEFPELRSTLNEIVAAFALFETDFEEIPVGEPPEQWTRDPRFDEFDIFEVQSGGAAGTQKKLRTRSKPYQTGGTENKWGSRALSPEFDQPIDEAEWYWKKQNKYDSAGGYGPDTSHGPNIHFWNMDEQPFCHLRLGSHSHHGENPLALGVRTSDGLKYISEAIEAGVFSNFLVQFDFSKQTFTVFLDGEDMGTYPFVVSADNLHRVAFKVGGWGVNADSEIDEFVLR